jgi:hypothetical protein
MFHMFQFHVFQEGNRDSRRITWLYPLVPLAAIFAGPASATTFCDDGENAGAVPTPVTYSGYVYTDVSLGGQRHHNARVTITFKANTSDIHKFKVTPGGNEGSGFCIDQGTATVAIEAEDEAVQATFLAGQVFVSFDTYNGGIGFGSYIGPSGLEPAYPLAYDDGTVERFTSDLSTPANMTGKAWSCIGYPPLFGSGFCTDPGGYPLKTNRGDFIMYMPYVKYALDGTISGDYSGTMNRGGFFVVTGSN